MRAAWPCPRRHLAASGRKVLVALEAGDRSGECLPWGTSRRRGAPAGRSNSLVRRQARDIAGLPYILMRRRTARKKRAYGRSSMMSLGGPPARRSGAWVLLVLGAL